MFKYSCLNFIPTMPPAPPIPTSYTLWLCPCILHACFLMPTPQYPPLSLSLLLSGHCQIVLYFSVSGCILIAYLFCWLGIISLWNACSINLLNKLDIKQNTKNPRQLYVPLANGQKMEHYQCILTVFINLFLI